MVKLILVLINLAGQPVLVSPYPITQGTPDATYADRATCEKSMPGAMQETQQLLDAQTHGQLAVAGAKCMTQDEIDKAQGKSSI